MSESTIIRQLDMQELGVLGERVFCDDELRFSWSPAEQLADGAALARLNGRNETVLRTVALVEEHDETQSEDAERAELHRMEAKLNLALELLAELLAARAEEAPLASVRFNARGVCWSADAPLEPEALLLVEFHVLPAWPVPLKLYARVRSSEERGRGRHRICAELEGLSTGVRDWLEKLVFRRHRRSVAQSRAAR